MMIFDRLVALDKSRGKQYDVIILDLDMPIMSGYEACQKIRGEFFGFDGGMGGGIKALL